MLINIDTTISNHPQDFSLFIEVASTFPRYETNTSKKVKLLYHVLILELHIFALLLDYEFYGKHKTAMKIQWRLNCQTGMYFVIICF